MTKYKFNKIAEKYGLTFKEAINLVAIKSEVMRNEKFEARDWFYINSNLTGREINRFVSLREKGFINLTNNKISMDSKGNEFPLNMGAISYVDSYDDEDILENVMEN